MCPLGPVLRREDLRLNTTFPSLRTDMFEGSYDTDPGRPDLRRRFRLVPRMSVISATVRTAGTFTKTQFVEDLPVSRRNDIKTQLVYGPTEVHRI